MSARWLPVGRARFLAALRMATLWKHKARDLQLRLQSAELRIETGSARQRQLTAELDTLKAEAIRQRDLIEQMTDNVLFGSGHAPVFHPEAERFRTRAVEEQRAEALRRPASMTAAEWRRRAEEMDRVAAERDRKGRLAEELKQLARERGAGMAAAGAPEGA